MAQHSQHTSQNRRLAPYRISFQWFFSLLILLLPWGHLNNISLLRLDIPHLSLQIFGATLRIEELYLFLFFSLALTLFFLLTTLVFGRVWCGWACPQTTLSDIAEWAAHKLKIKTSGTQLQGTLGRKIILHSLFLFLALLVGSNLLWYFIDPRQYFTQLVSGNLPPAAMMTLLIISTIVYLDMAFLRRLVCREFCPYGRLQTVLVDAGTLVLRLPESEAPRCIECNACVRICPMEIDIRQGYQIECINCGRCLDTCRKVMDKRQQPGLIGYYFGLEDEGWRALLNPRTLLLALGLCGMLVLLFFAVQSRPEASLKVALSHQVASRRTTDGTQISFFNAWIHNRTTAVNEYVLSAESSTQEETLELKGPTSAILLNAGQNRKVDFVLVSSFTGKESRVTFVLTTKDGQQLDSNEVLITPDQSR